MIDPKALFRIPPKKSEEDEPLGVVRGFPLLELIQWAATPDGLAAQAYGKLGLPPVQRGSVWKPKQIVDLWDSVFRGLPIGSFYVVQRDDEHELGREVRVGSNVIKMEPGWSLLDGQQRLHALIRGWQGPPTPEKHTNLTTKKEAAFSAMRCLWVDLADANGGVPRLHITSNSQPFGYDPVTGERLHSYQLKPDRMKETYKRREGEELIRDHELFAGLLSGEITRTDGDRKTWPPKPILAKNGAGVFPLHELLNAWLNHGKDLSAKKSVETFVGDSCSRQYSGAIDALDRAFEAFYKAQAALIRVSLPGDAPENGESKGEQMLRLFDRIGSGGTVLTQEERLYSIYKSYQPHVHNAVEAIYERCGAVLSPVKICGAVLRIAYARIHKNPEEGNHSLDVAMLIKHLSGGPPEGQQPRLRAGESLKGSLRSLIPEHNNPNDRLASTAFETVYTQLAFGVGKELGLPDVMLASLPAHCVEVLLMAELTYPQEGRCSSFWQDAIAFVLIWQLLVIESNEAAAVCFERIRKEDWSKEQFPFRSLYAELVSKKQKTVCWKIVAPADMNKILQVGKGHQFATWKERFSARDDVSAFTENNVRVAERWWERDGTSLLRWWQRGYLTELYGGFRPAFGSDEDTLYDIDHLIPRNDWGRDWRNAQQHFPKGDTGQDDSHYRWTRSQLGDSIGNKWLLDRSINREAADRPLTEKLDLVVERSANISDERMSRAIEELRNSMSRAGRENRNEAWQNQRLEDFQIAIQNRASELYREFYEKLELEAWLSDVSSKLRP